MKFHGLLLVVAPKIHTIATPYRQSVSITFEYKAIQRSEQELVKYQSTGGKVFNLSVLPPYRDNLNLNS